MLALSNGIEVFMKSQLAAGKLFLVGILALLSVTIYQITPVSAAVAHPYICGARTSSTRTNYDKTDGLKVVWDGAGTFEITPTHPLQQDVTLYLSDYILTNPNYDGGCFSHDASHGTFPQTMYKSQTVTIPAGTCKTITVTIPLPDACNNVQVDLYRGPELTTVGQAGHDNNGFISGGIVKTDATPACPTPPTGGKGGGMPTPPVTTTAQPTPPSKPTALLTDTGANTAVTSALAGLLMGAALFVSRRRPAAVPATEE